MKKLVYVLSLVLFLSLGGFVTGAWAEKPTCDDLTEMADALDEVAEAFEDAGNIREGDKVDRALGELVDALITISEMENEQSFSRAVDNLTRAYDDMDADNFGMSLDSVITNMDRLYRRDCE